MADYFPIRSRQEASKGADEARSKGVMMEPGTEADEQKLVKSVSLMQSQHYHLLHCLEKTTVATETPPPPAVAAGRGGRTPPPSQSQTRTLTRAQTHTHPTTTTTTTTSHNGGPCKSSVPCTYSVETLPHTRPGGSTCGVETLPYTRPGGSTCRVETLPHMRPAGPGHHGDHQPPVAPGPEPGRRRPPRAPPAAPARPASRPPPPGPPEHPDHEQFPHSEGVRPVTAHHCITPTLGEEAETTRTDET
ncbi:hypothetical protein CRUP_036648 [Coryphaenoides rupestris]|nr:hypothetical protein CRUP_036648 [Coryphaenoides rupestris]